MMKKVAGFALAFVACFGIVLVVSAAGSKTLGYKEYERITVDSMGTNFTTTIKASAKSGTPTIETKVGRKMFNLVFYDSGSNTVVINSLNTKYISTWTANGTWGTRATWTNITSGTSVTAVFELY